jgi:hypothetical protein
MKLLPTIGLMVCVTLMGIATGSVAAETAAVGDQRQDLSLLAQAQQLFQKGSWNDSEKIFLKAAGSPVLEERIAAYEGLIKLYMKLHLKKKAQRIRTKLEKEQSFHADLVPTSEEYYVHYTVRKGDSYAKIASREKVSQLWLEKANQSRALHAGENILVPNVPYYLVVNKTERKLYWRRGIDDIIKVYSVAVGKKETQTPEGEYRIVEKIKDPIWYKEHEIIPANDPKNLLGTRWMGLDQKGYGIHGTRHPWSIGGAVSHGCVRMHNRDVEELFEWVPIGTIVVIQ